MNHLRKNISLLLIAALAVSPLSGCGSMMEKSGSTLEVSLDTSYRTARFLPNEHGVPRCTWGSSVLLEEFFSSTLSKDANYSDLYWCDTETENSVRFRPKCVDDRTEGNYVQVPMAFHLEDGRTGIVCIESKAIYEEQCRRCIEYYDEQMQYLETVEIPDSFQPDMPYTYWMEYTWMDAAGNWYVLNENYDTGEEFYTAYNKDFEKLGNIDVENVASMTQGSQPGTMYTAVHKYDQETDQSYVEVFEVNAEDGTVISTQNFHDAYDFEFLSDAGDYDYRYRDAFGIYGVKDGETTQLLDWINSDVQLYTVRHVYALDKGQFIFDQWEGGQGGGMMSATPRTEEEIANIQLISLAVVNMEPKLRDAVIAYNRQAENTRIIVVDYGAMAEPGTNGYAQLKSDMLDGIVADMICADGLNFASLAGKGMFGDWYTLMDADEEFRREDYLSNFFTAYEYDAKLQRLGPSFTVLTAAAKTEYAGTEEGITPEQFAAYKDSMPEGMDLTNELVVSYKDYDLLYWFGGRQNLWINPYTGACSFDNPAFAAVLELNRPIPPEEQPQNDEEQQALFDAIPYAFREDRALVCFTQITEPLDYHKVCRATFGDAPLTWVGYPMEYDTGNGGIFAADFTVSYNPESERKAEMWDFMKYLLSADYQNSVTDAMPLHLETLQKRIDTTVRFKGAKVQLGNTEVNIGGASEEGMAAFRSYLEGIRTSYYGDEEVRSIIEEEFQAMLAGDASAEETAALIQSRVSLYLSEQS